MHRPTGSRTIIFFYARRCGQRRDEVKVDATMSYMDIDLSRQARPAPTAIHPHHRRALSATSRGLPGPLAASSAIAPRSSRLPAIDTSSAKSISFPRLVAKHIAYIEEVHPSATSHDVSRQVGADAGLETGHDIARQHVPTSPDMSRQDATGVAAENEDNRQRQPTSTSDDAPRQVATTPTSPTSNHNRRSN